MSRTLVKLVAVGTVFVVGAQVAADRLYMPVDIGTLGGDQSVALAMNEHAMVVGWAETAQPIPEAHAFLWKDHRIEDLGTLGGAWSEGRAINDLGVVVGASDTARGERRGFVWYDGVMHDLTELLRVPPPSELGDARGCYGQITVFVEANDINEYGWIVGCAYLEADVNLHAILVVPLFVGPPPAVDPSYFYMDLGRIGSGDDCLATGVSDTEVVVGISDERAFLWMDEKIRPLDRYASMSFAADVNNIATVVGWTQEPGESRTACMWIDGYRRDLGGLNEGISVANAVNDSDLVVGFATAGSDMSVEAMLWEGCIPYNLNDITVVPVRTVVLPWHTLTEATDVDRAGRIVGFGTSSEGHRRAVLLFDPTDPR